MADDGNVYDVSRDSCMYAITDIQGYLERKGVLGNRTKLWCSLQSSTLYMQKKQGDAMKTIDLKDCHQVRKVTSEITGTYLEICEKKKTHVFICPTSENCRVWVKALQAAMALKDSSQENTESTNVYDDCDYGLNKPKKNQEASPKISSQYAEPYDAQKVSNTETKENDYWEVGAVQCKMDNSQPTLQPVDNNVSSMGNEPEQIYDDAKSDGGAADQSICDQESYSDAYSLTQAVSTPPVASQLPLAIAQRADSTRNVIGGTDNVYSVVSSAANNQIQPFVRKTDTLTNVKLQESDHVFQDMDEDDSLFQILVDALSDHDSPIPDYIHPLTDEDSKPAEDLLKFLTDNQNVCQVSYSFVPISDDPVKSLKSYLETIGLSSRESSHS